IATMLALFTFFLGWCLGSLSSYHLWLIAQGITTNEHVKQQRGELPRRPGRFWSFFFRPMSRSYFDLKAPLGNSVYVRTLVPVGAAGEAVRQQQVRIP